MNNDSQKFETLPLYPSSSRSAVRSGGGGGGGERSGPGP